MTINPLSLHDYQRQSLDALRDYLREVRQSGNADRAFHAITKRAYQTAPGMDGIPYICLRVPTGGGKTLMACHALKVVADEWIQQEPAVFLWLAPSGAIVEQTLRRLRDKRDPYYQAVADAFGAQNFAVMDLREARQAAGEFRLPACIIVGTIQSLRREDTGTLKIYEDSGALMKCFDGVGEEEKRALEADKIGVFSLAALLRTRPLAVVVDEAHNARRPLSFQTLARLLPDCIVELTATPRTQNDAAQEHYASNVLHHCSALELKAAQMIKMPIELHTLADWRQAIINAAAMRAQLEKDAQAEQGESGGYLRPIALYQAEAIKDDGKINVNIVRGALIEGGAAEEEIAIAVGGQNEIQGVDLLSPQNKIRHIITVQQLAEGWDCPFAYILCALSNIATQTAVEQILGRVLRMPGAKRKSRPSLNRAYAYAVSPSFNQTAGQLRDALVEYAGFKKLETNDLVIKGGVNIGQEGGLFGASEEGISETPDLSKLPSAVRRVVNYDEVMKELTVRGVLSEPEIVELQKCFATSEGKKAAAIIARSVVAHKIRIPLLAVRQDGQLSIFDEDAYLETTLSLQDCDAELSESEFTLLSRGVGSGTIDIEESKKSPVIIRREAYSLRAAMLGADSWEETQLIAWLDKNIPHPDIPATDALSFISRAVSYLFTTREMTLPQLVARRFALKDALAAKINVHRNAQKNKIFQGYLFGDMKDAIEVDSADPALCVEIGENDYAPNELHKDPGQFNKHLFPSKIGSLDSDGEAMCAEYLDNLSQVKKWLRNVPRSDKSFWLPRPKQNHAYPDFIAELNDGRFLVVETKGEHLWEGAKEDRLIGEVWMNRSGGKCVYVMVKLPSRQQDIKFDAIAEAIKPIAKHGGKGK